MRFRKSAAAMAATMAAGAAFAVLPAAPAAADSAYPFPRILLDEPNGHVYVSTGGQLPYVEVFDLAGHRVGTIEDQDSATGMALSPDNGTLYIAHAELGTISAVDTTTLRQTAVYRTGVDTEYLTFAGGRLWFGYQTADRSESGLGTVDVVPSTPTVRLVPLWQWSGAAPELVTSPTDPDTVVASSSTVPDGVAVYDVSSGTPVTTAMNQDLGVVWDGTFAAGNGQDVAFASGSGATVQFYRLSDLMPDGPAITVDHPVYSLAVAPDGTAAAGDYDYWHVPAVGVSVVARGESAPRRTYQPQTYEGGLAWASDGSRLYAVSGGVTGLGTTDPVLDVYDHPEQADTTMALDAPATAEAGTPYTVSGKLTSVPAFGAQSVRVVRTDAADPDGWTLAPPTVDPDGTFSFTETAAAPGDVSYQVVFDGDRDHRPAQQSATVTVTQPARAATTLWLQFEDRARVGRKLKLSGRLTSPLSIPAGATVTITRTDATGPGAALVGTRKVAADGTFQIADVPLVAGPALYTASFAGDDAYAASTVSATAQVAP